MVLGAGRRPSSCLCTDAQPSHRFLPLLWSFSTSSLCWDAEGRSKQGRPPPCPSALPLVTALQAQPHNLPPFRAGFNPPPLIPSPPQPHSGLLTLLILSNSSKPPCVGTQNPGLPHRDKIKRVDPLPIPAATLFPWSPFPSCPSCRPSSSSGLVLGSKQILPVHNPNPAVLPLPPG